MCCSEVWRWLSPGFTGTGCNVPGVVPPFGKLRRLPKYGRSRGKQRYRCQQCHYHFTLDAEHPHQPERVKNMAVAMYAEGNSI